MGRLKVIGAGMVVVIPLVVMLTGLLSNTEWQLSVASLLLAACVVVTGMMVSRAVATSNQRLSGLIKLVREQNARLVKVESLVDSQINVTYTVPPEVKRAHEDLVLASRSLTVPQAHFDQLLRTISANTVRTETAIDELSEQLQLRNEESHGRS